MSLRVEEATNGDHNSFAGHGGGDAMIQIIYMSAVTDSFPEDSVADFLSAARARNKARGVTGIIVRDYPPV